MTWTTEQAIKLAEKTEAILEPHGYHVALTGGCLYKGGSDKDCDFIIYPHKSSNLKTVRFLCNRLKLSGFSDFSRRDHIRYGDEKTVFKCNWGQKRVDFIFVGA